MVCADSLPVVAGTAIAGKKKPGGDADVKAGVIPQPSPDIFGLVVKPAGNDRNPCAVHLKRTEIIGSIAIT
jgi:hypothetical protein